jgi:hypothetical protein
MARALGRTAPFSQMFMWYSPLHRAVLLRAVDVSISYNYTVQWTPWEPVSTERSAVRPELCANSPTRVFGWMHPGILARLDALPSVEARARHSPFTAGIVAVDVSFATSMDEIRFVELGRETWCPRDAADNVVASINTAFRMSNEGVDSVL